MRAEISGWGRYPRHVTELFAASRPDQAATVLAGKGGVVARGNGRAYGDAAIGEQTTLSIRGLDRMRAFDPSTGLIEVEAGTLLSDVINAFLPRGFFPVVVPGTKHVTIGGMIAADVHGKNHHRDGGFANHVESLSLMLPGGEIVTCSQTERPELFRATVGGMGLTGTIIDARFRLKRVETGWMRQQTIVAADLDAAIAVLRQTDSATYSVAWIDCLARGAALGRSLIYLAEHATRAEFALLRPRGKLFPSARGERVSTPVDLPGWALGRPTVSAFNALYYRRGASTAGDPFLVHWEPYFFPLDGVGSWNRAYGGRGFLQHQCVIPESGAREVLGDILDRVSRGGNASFLAVLKRLGSSFGTISFPIQGYTLALDIQVSEDAFALLDEIDALVAEAGGRLYLAKDARQSRATFEAGYPGLAEFRDIRHSIGADGRIASRLSTRLGV